MPAKTAGLDAPSACASGIGAGRRRRLELGRADRRSTCRPVSAGAHTRQWFPDAQMTAELKLRWRCSAQLARRENPTLGWASLRGKAIKIYRSKWRRQRDRDEGS